MTLPLALSLMVAATADGGAGDAVLEPPPVLNATRIDHAPKLDGLLDDDVWKTVPVQDRLIQQSPDPGAAPSQHTEYRIAYDATTLYIAFRCDDSDPATMVHRPTRRDRFVETEGVWVEIDSLGDKTSAYGFAVNATGTQLDYLKTGDNALDFNWDAVWDSAAHIDDHGYTVEMAIPFGVLRFSAAPEVTFRVNLYRFINRREEWDETVFTPADAQGQLLRMATLTGLKDLPASRGLELRPFALLKLDHRYSPGPGYDPPSGTSPGFSAGGDITYHPTRNLVLDAALLPDFGQVEADQVVLNLRTVETFFPEKRPCFLSGAARLTLHAAVGNTTTTQLFYSRRVGAPPSTPQIGGNETLLSQPVTTDIWGAAKLTGKVSDHVSIALLDATPAQEQATIDTGNGAKRQETVANLSNFAVARARADLPDGFTAGVMATGVNQQDSVRLVHPYGCPIPADTNNVVVQPDGGFGSPARDGRCSHDAYSGAVDVNWSSPDGAYVFSGALLGSRLVAGPDVVVPDGTVIHSGDVGYGGMASLAKADGRWLGGINYEAYSPKLDLDTAGYLREANLHHLSARLGWRQVEPIGPLLYAEAYAMPSLQYSTDGANLGTTATAYVFVRWKNYWVTYLELDPNPSRFDNRETRDGAKYERPGTFGGSWYIGSDSRAAFHMATDGFVASMLRGSEEHIGLQAVATLFDRLELSLNPRIDWSHGDPRWVGTLGDPLGVHQYYFADLDARATSITLRGTFTVTPNLTFQAYAQLYLQTNHYTASWMYRSQINQPYIYLDLLQPIPALGGLDYQAGTLNVNLVARWEYRPGSLLYLVYTRAQTPGDSSLNQNPLRPDLPALRHGPYDDVVLLKASYYFGTCAGCRRWRCPPSHVPCYPFRVRLAIVSDIHGNLLALEAVLKDIARQGVDLILCGGDVALKGSRPAESVDLLHSRCAAFVKGNTDAYLTGELPLRNYGNPQHWKYRLYAWTAAELGPARVAQMRTYGFSHRISGNGQGDLLLGHANPQDMEAAIEPHAPDSVVRGQTHGVDAAILAFGHLHIPYQKRVGNLLLVDVASVGNPRDRDPRPAYGLFTLGEAGWSVELRRVDYPLLEAANDFRRRGVPGGSRLARKLVDARFGR